MPTAPPFARKSRGHRPHLLHWCPLHHDRPPPNQRPAKNMDGRRHAPTRRPREAHGPSNSPKAPERLKPFTIPLSVSAAELLGKQVYIMTSIVTRFMLITSNLLQPFEREAVLGDLVESGESRWRGLFAVLGLWMRRQADTMAQLASLARRIRIGFTRPAYSSWDFLLSVSHAYQQWISLGVFRLTGLNVSAVGLSLLLCNLLILCGWAWTGGFVIGSFLAERSGSVPRCHLRRVFSAWRDFGSSLCLVSVCCCSFHRPCSGAFAAACKSPPSRFARHLSLPSGLPSLPSPSWSSKGSWIPNWAPSWPAWYLVATAPRPEWLLGEHHHAK